MLTKNIILIAVGIVSPMITFYANDRLRQGPVRSSACLSLIVAGFFYFFPGILNQTLVKNIPAVFIGGSFIGMASAKLVPSYLRLAFAGLIFTIIYLNTSHFFNGYGGALGTTASISLLVTLTLPFVNLKGKLTSGFLQIRNLIYSRKEN